MQLECNDDLSCSLDAAEGRTAAVSYLLQPAVIADDLRIRLKP